jgi:phosphoglycolate phosphatase
MTRRNGEGIAAILLDKDGTLTDFRATWEPWMARALRRLAEGDEARAARAGAAVGYDLARRSFARDALFVTAPAARSAAALAAALGRPAEAIAGWLSSAEAEAPQVPAAPIAPLLDGLRARGLRLGLLTNDTEAGARAYLDGAGLSWRLDMVVAADSGWGAKPGCGGARAFAAAMRLPPRAVLVVGDGLADMQAARGAGMRAVAVLTGAMDHAGLAPHAEAVLPNVADLPAWLDAPRGAAR